MRVIYQGVDLFALETHEFSAEPVYDDSMTDYLYTKFSLYVTATVAGLVEIKDVNGPQMSYRFNGGVTGNTPTIDRPPTGRVGLIIPGSGDGIDVGVEANPLRDIEFVPSRVPVTLQTVRHRLSTPRGALYVFAGGGFEVGNPAGGFGIPQPPKAELILSSPVGPYDVDCKNGPFPKKFDVIAAMGDAQTMVAEFAIETYVNEAEQNNAHPFSALLSNRFKQRHSVDDSGYTTVMTEGLAIFRTDMVYFNNTSPDVSRPILFMPLPQAFTRVVDYVEGREDVSGIAYGYTDTQVPVNFVAGPYVGAAKISAVHRQAVTCEMDPMGKLVEIMERAVGFGANVGFIRHNLKGR